MPHSLLPPRHRANAKSMRKAMTDAELKLWNELRAHRLMGLGFRRQFPIAGYIVDFACPEKKLIVEVDGSQHSDAGFAEADEIRSKRLEQDGWTVLRFWNDDVIRTSTMSVSILLLRQDWLDQSETPAGQRPPLSCRTSPPQGGRSAVPPLASSIGLHHRPLQPHRRAHRFAIVQRGQPLAMMRIDGVRDRLEAEESGIRRRRIDDVDVELR